MNPPHIDGFLDYASTSCFSAVFFNDIF